MVGDAKGSEEGRENSPPEFSVFVLCTLHFRPLPNIQTPGTGCLTISPRVRIRYELAIIISYPTSACEIIVLLTTATKYREFFPTLFVKTTDFQLIFNLSRRVQLPPLESMVQRLIYHDG